MRWIIRTPLLDIAKELEEIALKDPYFIDHNLYPNVDFYSGIVLRGHWHSHQHVYRHVRNRTASGVDRPVEREHG